MSNARGAARYAARWILVCVSLALLATTLVAVMSGAKAWAAPGGVSAVSSTVTPEPTAPPGRALLVEGRAVVPLDAPPAVKGAVAAANRIRTKPYIWGGGHGRWWDRGYDCSGAVSFALHGGGLLDSPLPSGSMTRWGRPGRGRWITVYANGGHAFAVIAGLRWDTSGNVRGTGPRWHADMASTRGFVARHPMGY
jgi:cell wall-associated NlpC family hydrolase